MPLSGGLGGYTLDVRGTAAVEQKGILSPAPPPRDRVGEPGPLSLAGMEHDRS